MKRTLLIILVAGLVALGSAAVAMHQSGAARLPGGNSGEKASGPTKLDEAASDASIPRICYVPGLNGKGVVAIWVPGRPSRDRPVAC